MLKPYSVAEIQFSLTKKLGEQGKNSETSLAHDRQMDAEIVIKKIKKENFKEGTLDKYFSEAQILNAVSHPNVVQLYYACQDRDYIYLAMPYYEKGSVKSLLDERRLSVREIISLSCQVLTAVHNIHTKGLIHFDIKPDNILISSSGEALLSDFGLAKWMGINARSAQSMLYVPMRPPESFEREDHCNKFDIYQFGLTLYRMCNGNKHFYEQVKKYQSFELFSNDVLKGIYPDRRSFEPHIPVSIRKIVGKCLEVNPEDRYQTALEVANALADIDGTCLDWVPDYGHNADKRIWTKSTENTHYELVREASGHTVCYKSVNGGKRRKVTDASGEKLTDREFRRIFGRY